LTFEEQQLWFISYRVGSRLSLLTPAGIALASKAQRGASPRSAPSAPSQQLRTVEQSAAVDIILAIKQAMPSLRPAEQRVAAFEVD